MYTKASVKYYVSYAVLCLCSFISAQNTEVKEVSVSLDQFALKFLAETSQQADGSINLALSPYTIWSLMVIISEGAKNNTAIELERTLGLPSLQNRDVFRQLYESFGNYLNKKNDPGVKLETTSSIYTSNADVKPNFRQIAESTYKVDISKLNFADTINAANTINKRIYHATNGRISNFVKPDDLTNARVFMTSTLYFKGSWAKQFNRTATKNETFYDDSGNKLGEVAMMYDIGSYPYSLVLENAATAVELPYKGNSMGMILLLPRRNVPLQTVLNTLSTRSFTEITDALDKAVEYFGDEPVHVFVPKFRIISDLNLNFVLHQMGIKDIFNAKVADFSGMFDKPLFISRVLQRAEIDVDEDGTVASSASGAEFEYKSPPPRFIANKPFAYFIYDKTTKGIVFAGKISNPNKLQ